MHIATHSNGCPVILLLSHIPLRNLEEATLHPEQPSQGTTSELLKVIPGPLGVSPALAYSAEWPNWGQVPGQSSRCLERPTAGLSRVPPRALHPEWLLLSAPTLRPFPHFLISPGGLMWDVESHTDLFWESVGQGGVVMFLVVFTSS